MRELSFFFGHGNILLFGFDPFVGCRGTSGRSFHERLEAGVQDFDVDLGAGDGGARFREAHFGL